MDHHWYATTDTAHLVSDKSWKVYFKLEFTRFLTAVFASMNTYFNGLNVHRSIIAALIWFLTQMATHHLPPMNKSIDLANDVLKTWKDYIRNQWWNFIQVLMPIKRFYLLLQSYSHYLNVKYYFSLYCVKHSPCWKMLQIKVVDLN